MQAKDGCDYLLGLTPTGILLYEVTPDPNQQNERAEKIERIGLFLWHLITKLDFKKKRLTLVVIEDDDESKKQEYPFVFRFVLVRYCLAEISKKNNYKKKINGIFFSFFLFLQKTKKKKTKTNKRIA